MSDLENNFISMGIPTDQAKKLAEDFKTGLKELGLADTETTIDLIPVIQKNDPLEKALVKIGVKPALVQRYGASIKAAMNEFLISTKEQKSMFLAQILHESGMLSRVTENLNYSEQGLVLTFKKYFDRNTAKNYARKPEKIANRVYANRMGNGNESSGDGWQFRGRGLIQITGKTNYTLCGKALNVDLLSNPSYLETPEGASRSAGWFWKVNNLNRSADRKDIKENTRIINGGYKGLGHRIDLYQKLLPLM
jgi:putative chitinase